jgi:hypothetical protein
MPSTRIVVVDDCHGCEHHSTHDWGSQLREWVSAIISQEFSVHGPQNRKHRQLGRGTNKVRSARTVLNLGLEKIYAGTRFLFWIVPAGPPILYDAAESLACKPCQSRLQRSAAQVVEVQCSVDAASVQKLQSAQIRLHAG